MGDGISKEKFEEYKKANSKEQEKMRQQYEKMMADKKQAEIMQQEKEESISRR